MKMLEIERNKNVSKVNDYTMLMLISKKLNTEVVAIVQSDATWLIIFGVDE